MSKYLLMFYLLTSVYFKYLKIAPYLYKFKHIWK